ncbi:MAG: TIM-barrel domain-containing protein [Acidimicrobiales bacterium]
MLRGISLREEGSFRLPAPTFEAVQRGQAEAVVRLRLVGAVPGGASFTGTTSDGSTVSVQLRLVGRDGALHCRLRADGVPAEPRLVLARRIPPGAVELKQEDGQVVLATEGRTVRVDLEPAHISVEAGALVLHQDGATEDVSGQVVALPLGFTRLTSGALAYHESFPVEPDEHFWGLGERFTCFDKRGQLISCWNHDALGTQSAQSYKNVPFLLSSRGYGCFVDTTTNVYFDCCHSSQAFWSVVVPDEELDYYLVFGGPRQCLAQYQELVGGPELPPAWALGTWVSTGDMPADEDDVREMARRLDAEDVPHDVIHLDAFWQTFGCWSDLRWDPGRFPVPVRLLGELKEAGVRPCLWLNPYIGVDSPLFAAAERAGYFLKLPDGLTYIGPLWGTYHPAVAIIDITNPEACAWWGALLAERLKQGAAIFKTDFGEEIPAEVRSHSGLAGPRLHNAYSLLYNDFVTSVMRAAGIDRPVVWARSSWAGGQRHVGQWAGDPNSDWRDLASTLRAGLSMALSGHAFWSHDIGGFHGRPGTELYVRWAQFGMLSPLTRFHGMTTRLPWDYGPEALAAVRAVTKLRYGLHPYLYAAAAESVRDAVPIMRPMVLDFPEQPEAQAADLQYLLGPDLLVAPLYRPGGRRLVWFPPGEWLHYGGGPAVHGPGFHEVAVPLEQAPLWVRSASTILLAPPRRRLGDGHYDRLVLALVGDGDVAAARVEVPSYGGLAITVEGGAGGPVSVTAPDGLPPIEVVTVGAATTATPVLLNGTPVAAGRLPGLPVWA